jgi:outer membrane protein assembly factor BamB
MERVSRAAKAKWIGIAVLALLIAIAVVVLPLSSPSSDEESLFSGSGYPGADVSNTRQMSGSIDSATVSDLEAAWSLPLTAKSAFGSYASSPVIANGVVYSQDLASNVEAISLASGKVLWRKSYESPDVGPNGLVVAAGRVFGATAEAAFALDQKTGEQVWSVPLVRDEHEGIDMAPGYRHGLVYVSTAPVNLDGSYLGDAAGILWALDAKTGEKKWHFNTVPDGLWGDKSLNSGGGLWYPPSFDDKGFMYFGVGNPAPFPGTASKPWGASRPGPNLYTDSLVKLDAKTGKLQWYFQQTPHDLYDWDFQDPPILIGAGGRQLAIGAGKSGVVVALGRETGKPVWRRSVGIHNGHDDDGLHAMRGEYKKLKTPMTVFPGELGGVIAPMATDGSTLFVPVVNAALTVSSQVRLHRSEVMTGELVALDAATGAVKWDRQFPAAAFGAPTVVNDLVFATTFDGKVYALATDSGKVVWKDQLPAGTNSGVAVAGDTVIAPAGVAAAEGQSPRIVAYRLGR